MESYCIVVTEFLLGDEKGSEIDSDDDYRTL